MNKRKGDANWRKEKKERKEKLMTASDWRNLLQKVFNTYIRTRDKGKPCVTCNKPFKGKFDAGHYYSVGSYPNLRYNEDNVHGQCVRCNRDLHGNLAEYAILLPMRIGQDRFDLLTAEKNSVLKLSVDEIQGLIAEYKRKTKELG